MPRYIYVVNYLLIQPLPLVGEAPADPVASFPRLHIFTLHVDNRKKSDAMVFFLKRTMVRRDVPILVAVTFNRSVVPHGRLGKSHIGGGGFIAP